MTEFLPGYARWIRAWRATNASERVPLVNGGTCFIGGLFLIIGLFVPVMSRAEDLVAIYQQAEVRDPQFKGVEAAHQATLEALPQAQAGLLPQINISSNVAQNFQNFTRETTTTSDPSLPSQIPGRGDIDFLSHGYSLNITQPIYRHERFVQLRQADSRIRQAEAEVGAARQELMLRVADRYFGVLAAQDNLEFALAEKKALERQLEQAKQRFEVGLIAITDVQEAQAGHDQAVAQAIQAENQLDNTRETLREITSAYPGELSRLRETIPLISPEPPDIEQWTQKALQQNLNIFSAQFATETARQEIERQRSGHWPSLDLVGSHGLRSSGSFGSDFESEDSVIGLELNVPIYEGGLVNSRTSEAQHLHEQALEQLEQARRAAHRQTREAYLGVISGISQVEALKQAIVSNETAVEATKAGFDVGTRTAVDTVIAERGLSQARRDYARARYDYILNSLRLKQAAGLLSIEDLVKVNGWLKPSSVMNREDQGGEADDQKDAPSIPLPPKESRSIQREDWINTQNPEHFTIQLATSADERAIVDLLNHQNLGAGMAYFKREINGKTHYTAIYGAFASSQSAVEALASLSPAIKKSKPMVRQFSVVKGLVLVP